MNARVKESSSSSWTRGFTPTLRAWFDDDEHDDKSAATADVVGLNDILYAKQRVDISK